jgi:excisionase family DNA binding protein
MYELVASGEIHHVKIGRRVLISKSALDEFISTHSRRGYYQ